MKMFGDLKPFGNLVLVRIDAVERTTAGGIIIPEQSKDRQEAMQSIGTVVALGPQCYADSGGPEAWGVVEGAKVFFNKNSAISLPSSDEEEKLLRFAYDTDILAGLGVSHA
jgi:co-chaperonin GroES (HSP10)